VASRVWGMVVSGAVGVGAAIAAAGVIEDAIGEGGGPRIRSPFALPSLPSLPSVPSTPAPVPEQPRGPELSGPLYRPANFARVLAFLRAEGGPAARVFNMRVDADDVVAQIVGRGRRKIVIVRASGERRVVSIPATPGLSAFPLRQLRPDSAARMVAAVARAARVSTARVDYLVATVLPIENRPGWIAFVRVPLRTFRANLDATGLERLG
jgi:hypothetical protein